MPHKKKNIVIDLRPIQKFQDNGVCISQKHLINQLLKDHSHKANFYLFSSGKQKPLIKFKGRFQHKHIFLPNKILTLLFKFKIIELNHFFKKTIHSYYCPDLRLVNLGENCKHIQYIHDLAFTKFKESLSLKSKIHYWLLNFTQFTKSIDNILTNSNFSKQEIQKKCTNQKIKIIKLGFPKVKTTTSNAKKNGFICINSLHKRKAFEKIIEFNNKLNLSKEPINIYGVQEKNFKRIQTIKAENISFHGHLPEKDKAQTIKEHKALLYFSHYEGFGLPILEALNLKVPVISNTNPTFKELHKQQINYIESLKNLDNLKIGENKYKNQLKKAARQLWKQITC